jgi:hypothetical protein
MPVTIINIPNPNSKVRKFFVIEHDETLGKFKLKVQEIVARELEERFPIGESLPICWDEIWGAIEREIDIPCDFQILDLDLISYKQMIRRQ